MISSETNRKGLWNSVRRICASLLAGLHSRFELFATELQEEKLRMLNLVVWLGFGLALGTAAVLIGLGTLSLLVWSSAGYAGLAGLALAALVAAGSIFWGIRRRLRTGPGPFADTISEFRKDREWLLRKN